MKITKQSSLTGATHTLDLEITQEQLDRWEAGEHIQNVVPEMAAHDREFLISGSTKEEWDKAFPKEDEDTTELNAVVRVVEAAKVIGLETEVILTAIHLALKNPNLCVEDVLDFALSEWIK